MRNAAYKIIQIMPADGWAAMYNEGDTVKYYPLTGWVLVEKPDGFRVIRGVSCDRTNNISDSAFFEPHLFPEDDNDFIGYKKVQSDGTEYVLDWAYVGTDRDGKIEASRYKPL